MKGQFMAARDYSALTADEATKLLADFYKSQMDILRDGSKGYLRTAFGVFAGATSSGMAGLRDAVLEKNGIKKIEAKNVCHNYLPEIVAAVEARGSYAADPIKRYNQFIKECEAKARYVPSPDFKGPFAGMRSACHKIKTRIDIAKAMP